MKEFIKELGYKVKFSDGFYSSANTIYVPRDLEKYTEADIAFMIGHELSHIKNGNNKDFISTLIENMKLIAGSLSDVEVEQHIVEQHILKEVRYDLEGKQFAIDVVGDFGIGCIEENYEPAIKTGYLSYSDRIYVLSKFDNFNDKVINYVKGIVKEELKDKPRVHKKAKEIQREI